MTNSDLASVSDFLTYTRYMQIFFKLSHVKVSVTERSICEKTYWTRKLLKRPPQKLVLESCMRCAVRIMTRNCVNTYQAPSDCRRMGAARV